MAPPSHRSSSPSMVAGRTSPNSRNSEIVNPIRRSFSSEPRSLNFITPTNSPSDYPRRNSTSRENLFNSRDNEEKENGKNQSPKPIRIRSPAAGKSTKNFMSPTISAASKISVSPKKKILGDRNEPVRSSLSFSGSKSSSLNSVNPNPEASAALESNMNQEIAPISNPKSSKTMKFGGFEVITGSESTHRYDQEVAPVAVETDTESEIAPISKSTIAAAPLRASKTVKSGGVDVISDSHSESTYDTNSEVVTMAVETDAKLEIFPVSNSAIAASPPKASETVEFADVQVSSGSNNDLESPAKNSSTEELDTVDLNPSFKNSHDSSSMEIAPLDADPLMPPPYDPKTNYLSPRPQFLHYKPRRINQLELDGKLEELFSSESEFTEGTDSEDPPMESDEASSNESHMKEEEREEEEEEEEVIVNVSEQSPVEAKNSSKLHFSRIFKISSLLLILLTACFSICVVNVHDLERASLLPMEDSTEVFEFAKTNFNVLVRKFEVWHANSRSYISDMVFNIGGRRPLIYLNQTGFLHKDINSEEQCLVLSHQTLWEEENDLNVMEEARKEGEIDIVEVPVVRGDQNEEEELLLEEIEDMKEGEIVIEHVEGKVQNEEESFQEIEANANDPKDGEEENGQASAKSTSEELLQETEEGSLKEIIEETSTKSASDELDEEDKIQERQTEENYEVSSSPDFIHDQIEQEAATGGSTEEEQQNDSIQLSNAEIQHQSPPVSPPSSAPQSEVEDENGSNIDLVGAATNNRISRDFSQNTAVIASAILLGLSIIIPAGLIYARKSGSKTSSMAAIAEEKEEQPSLKEKKTYQSPAVQEEEGAINDDDREDIARKGFCSSEMSSFLQYSNMKEEEEAINDDDDREIIARKGFCSSETSSFLQHSSMKEEDVTEAANKWMEAQNHSHGRRKTRKNSRTPMASSSLDEFSVSTPSASPSYGSFTTYEKIPIKHGNEEEEIVTPVRRSSRIRKTTHR